jgi:hypothetical protein
MTNPNRPASALAVEATSARQILEEMAARTEAAILALSDGDGDAVNAALSERDRLLERADVVLSRLHESRGASPGPVDPIWAAAGVLDAAMRLQSVSRRLQQAIEVRRDDLAHQLASLDHEESLRGGYARTGSRPQGRINIVR